MARSSCVSPKTLAPQLQGLEVVGLGRLELLQRLVDQPQVAVLPGHVGMLLAVGLGQQVPRLLVLLLRLLVPPQVEVGRAQVGADLALDLGLVRQLLADAYRGSPAGSPRASRCRGRGPPTGPRPPACRSGSGRPGRTWPPRRRPPARPAGPAPGRCSCPRRRRPAAAPWPSRRRRRRGCAPPASSGGRCGWAARRPPARRQR